MRDISQNKFWKVIGFSVLLLCVPDIGHTKPLHRPDRGNLQLEQYRQHLLQGQVKPASDLSKRDRSLFAIAVLVATNHTKQLREEIKDGLDDGLRPLIISAAITHLAFYCGWPDAESASDVMLAVFSARKIHLDDQTNDLLPVPHSDAARTKLVNDNVGPVSPDLAELTNVVLFGDLWRRQNMTPRDRSLVTIAALAAKGETDQLAFHVKLGMQNGLSRQEISAFMIQLAIYAGWPRALAATAVVAKIWSAEPSSAK